MTSQSISTETRAENSLIGKDRGSQKSLHEKSVEIVDFRLTRSFWDQVSSRMVVITSLLGLTLIALSSILGPSDLPDKYLLHLPPGESHLEAKVKQAQVEESDFGDRKGKVKEKPENLDDKTVHRPESISSTEDLPEVYENIATSANIRARPTIDSRIITEIPHGEEIINVVGKNGQWTMLKLDDGSVAWIHRSHIRRKPTNTHSSGVPQ